MSRLPSPGRPLFSSTSFSCFINSVCVTLYTHKQLTEPSLSVDCLVVAPLLSRILSSARESRRPILSDPSSLSGMSWRRSHVNKFEFLVITTPFPAYFLRELPHAKEVNLRRESKPLSRRTECDPLQHSLTSAMAVADMLGTRDLVTRTGRWHRAT